MTNPCTAVALSKVGRKRVPYCSPEDFHAIFAHVPDVLRQAMLVVFYQTGIRLNEAADLTWQDIDFEAATLHVTRREADGFIQTWSPKDHELREIPLPDQALNALAALQAQAPEGCPYVFMERERWEYYRSAVLAKTWKPGRSLLNNVLRRFKTLCKRAGVRKFTIHDLRRSCITNWARKLPIHVTQQFEAGTAEAIEPRTIYVLAEALGLPVGGLMQLAGLVAIEDSLSAAAASFTARLRPTHELCRQERDALATFVRALKKN
jgi:integrase